MKNLVIGFDRVLWSSINLKAKGKKCVWNSDKVQVKSEENPCKSVALGRGMWPSTALSGTVAEASWNVEDKEIQVIWSS